MFGIGLGMVQVQQLVLLVGVVLDEGGQMLWGRILIFLFMVSYIFGFWIIYIDADPII